MSHCSCGYVFDTYLYKLNSSGNKLWKKKLHNYIIRNIANDIDGNIYLSGSSHENGQRVIIKYNSQGLKLWTKIISNNNIYINALFVDKNKNIYIAGKTGYYSGFNNHSHMGKTDIFVVKLNLNGDEIWSRVYGTSDFDEANSIVVDKNSNVYISGNTKGVLENSIIYNDTDIFVMKIDTNGTQMWVKQFGSNGTDKQSTLAIDNNNNIYTSGYTFGSIDNQPNEGIADIFITSFDENGTKLWTKQYGFSGYDTVQSIIYEKDKLYILAYAQSMYNSSTENWESHMIISKMDIDSREICTKFYEENDYMRDMAISSINGDYFLVGNNYDYLGTYLMKFIK